MSYYQTNGKNGKRIWVLRHYFDGRICVILINEEKEIWFTNMFDAENHIRQYEVK